MALRSENYRLEAIRCEERASLLSDVTTKQEWLKLAEQWHLLAQLTSPVSPNEDIELK